MNTKASSISMAAIGTPMGRRYLGQLCKHFQHRLPIDLDETTGRIAFPMGDCLLRATKDSLHLACEAPDDEALKRLEDVVARHLLRFAFRETLEITWIPAQ